MSTTRIPSGFNDPIINERLFLDDILNGARSFPEVRCIGEPSIDNPCNENRVGRFRLADAKECVTTDWETINKLKSAEKSIPAFLAAGPRRLLFHDPQKVRAAIVTTGGIAPGLNSVIHSIVKRHHDVYGLLSGKGKVFGVQDSFLGACDLYNYRQELTPLETERWLERGGSMIGMRRFIENSKEELAAVVSKQLDLNNIDILYVIGGDGSLSTAHEIAKQAINVSVVGIPKTMDNDVMWVWESFGFKTAVEKATEIINTLNAEAESTRRICLIELFGAESGFVAAHSALASGHVDLVIIPEEFLHLSKEQCEHTLTEYIEYLRAKVKTPPDGEKSHAVVVLAEGATKILGQKGVELSGKKIDIDGDKECGLLELFKEHLKMQEFKDTRGNKVEVFFNRPRHYIRASPANPQDKIYCEQLGALAVDSALAGYTDCMVSQWLTSYVLVPLELVANRHKRISPSGIFWKQVLNSTGQPTIEYQ